MSLSIPLKTCFSYFSNPIPKMITAAQAVTSGTVHTVQKLSSLKQSYDSITLQNCASKILSDPRTQHLMPSAFKSTRAMAIVNTTKQLYSLKQIYDSATLQRCISEVLKDSRVQAVVNKALKNTRLSTLSESDHLFVVGKKIHYLIQVGLTGQNTLNNSLKGAQAILLLGQALSFSSPLSTVLLVKEMIKFHDSATQVFQGVSTTKEVITIVHNLLTNRGIS